MKNTFLSLFATLLLSAHCLAQQDTPFAQIGLTGLPLIYLDNNPSNRPGLIDGYAGCFSLGKFLTQNIVFGARPYIGAVPRFGSMGVNSYGRFYFGKNKSRLFVDANMGLGYVWYARDETTSPFFQSNEDNRMLYNIAIGPGADVHLKNNFFLEITTQYLWMREFNSRFGTFLWKTFIPSIGIVKYLRPAAQ